jgi:uncharacterized membrane protein (DUF485 family)
MRIETGRDRIVAWAGTLTILATYFALMLMVVFAGSLLVHPIGDSPVTVGLVFGTGILIFCIAVSALYTGWRNRKDAP